MILIDNNLSPKLAVRLQSLFPGIAHVLEFGLEAVDDLIVWDFAKSKGFNILTKDKDFHNILISRGFPPKVIRLDCGNATTKRIEEIILKEKEDIDRFTADPNFGIMVIQ
jgi:predicted nuclease of predicted toxin-antitoxin system